MFQLGLQPVAVNAQTVQPHATCLWGLEFEILSIVDQYGLAAWHLPVDAVLNKPGFTAVAEIQKQAVVWMCGAMAARALCGMARRGHEGKCAIAKAVSGKRSVKRAVRSPAWLNARIDVADGIAKKGECLLLAQTMCRCADNDIYRFAFVYRHETSSPDSISHVVFALESDPDFRLRKGGEHVQQ